MAIGGGACILGAAVFATRLPMLGRLVHPIYIRLGIVPQTAESGNDEAVPLASPWEARL